MRIKKYNHVLFLTVSIIFLLFFSICLPTYIHISFLSYPYHIFSEISVEIRHSYILDSKILKYCYYLLINEIPEWSIPTAILINGINMCSVFHSLKKKLWHYLICAVCLVISFLLADCYALYTEDSV